MVLPISKSRRKYRRFVPPNPARLDRNRVAMATESIVEKLRRDNDHDFNDDALHCALDELLADKALAENH